MAQPEHPQHGARFQIERVEDRGDSAVYEARVFVADGDVTFRVTFAGDETDREEVDRQPEELAPLPAWVDTHLDRLLRQVQRGAARNGSWPRRLRRWREDPNG